MLADRIEAKWIDAFCEIFERCAVKPGDTAAILSETQSRALNVHLAELALLRMGAKPFHIVVPTPRNRQIVPIRSTGASEAIQRLAPVVSALQQAGFVVDCTIEGLMHMTSFNRSILSSSIPRLPPGVLLSLIAKQVM